MQFSAHSVFTIRILHNVLVIYLPWNFERWVTLD
jgi:hypothetical protein